MSDLFGIHIVGFPTNSQVSEHYFFVVLHRNFVIWLSKENSSDYFKLHYEVSNIKQESKTGA